MSSHFHLRTLLFSLSFVTALGTCSCAVPLGPGYTIEKQEVRVQFLPAPEPRILVAADYQLRNTGNQPLSSLELRLPGRRRFHFAEPHADWDGMALEEQVSPQNARDTLLNLPQPWTIAARHTLRLLVQLQPPSPDQTGLSFSSDAFFLPSAGWMPELLPLHGLFGTGGVPPKRWPLVVDVPDGFRVHTSGNPVNTSRSRGSMHVTAVQRPADHYPFVVAGRYTESQLGPKNQAVYLWTLGRQDAAGLQQSTETLARTLQAYDVAFGSRAKTAEHLWIVECPVVAGCFTSRQSSYAGFLGDTNEATSAELASLDTVMIDLSGGAPKLAAAAPSLAATWLGYGQNPGFYEQEPPLSAFPAFAAALGREAIEGPAFRIQTIRRALRLIPRTEGSPTSEDASVLRAKSFLFFYALQDRYGREVFRNAVRHMLRARQSRGFDLDDLIASFGAESHQNVAEFVRLWMKRPGIPDDFRAKYETSSAIDVTSSKESTP